MYSNPNFCLHTDLKGKVWQVSPGKGITEFVFPSNRLEPGVYRVLGLPQNYKLIAELSYVARSPTISLLVGSPLVYSSHFEKEDVEKFLTHMRSLSVDESLSNCWHRINRTSFMTFVLLSQLKQENFGVKTQIAYACHPMKPYFDFLGCQTELMPVSLIAEIVDPRWYLHPEKPHRLSRLKSHFRLHRNQFGLDDKSSFKGLQATKNMLVLLAMLKVLPSTNALALENEHRQHSNTSPLEKRRSLCCLYLNFLIRHWLLELDYPVSFDTDKYFLCDSAKDAYLEYFGAS